MNRAAGVGAGQLAAAGVGAAGQLLAWGLALEQPDSLQREGQLALEQDGRWCGSSRAAAAC